MKGEKESVIWGGSKGRQNEARSDSTGVRLYKHSHNDWARREKSIGNMKGIQWQFGSPMKVEVEN